MNKKQRISIVFVVLALLLAAPYMGLPVHLQSLLYVIFFWMTLATSWNMLSGYSGYFSFGHGAFFGVGMYGMATLATKADWPVVPAALGSGVWPPCWRWPSGPWCSTCARSVASLLL